MNSKDKQVLITWLVSKASLNEVENTARIGLVGNVRFSENAVRWYKFIWEFSCHRLSSTAQDMLYNKHGLKALHRRFNRVNRIVSKLTGVNP